MNCAHRPLPRTLALAAGVALAGIVPLGTAASAASAAVTITPTQAYQGDEASVTFQIPNERGSAFTTKVEVDLPQDSPIAEVYPMTVPDWAPQIITRKATKPLPGIHSSDLNFATTAVIWTRADDAPPPPKVESLRLEMGPLPQVGALAFTVVQTYSDGKVHRWQPGSSASGATTGAGPVLTLSPLPAGADTGSAAHGHGATGQASGGGAADGTAAADGAAAPIGGDAVNAAAVAPIAGRPADQNLSGTLIGGVMGAGFAGLVAAFLAFSRRSTQRASGPKRASGGDD